MPRFKQIGEQYFDSDGHPLGGGKLEFFESGTSTQKTTYSDSDETVANTNPVILDAAGRQPDIFFTGIAKVTLKDSSDTLIETRDSVGATIANDDLSDWDATITYTTSDLVKASDDLYYTSITASNKGNDPTSSSGEWMEFKWIFRWDAAYDYAVGDFALSGSSLYVSLQTPNLNKSPTSEPTYWSNFNTSVAPGTVDGQTMVWDTTSGVWVPNSDWVVTDSGDATLTGALTAATYATDTITETTPAAGVTVDGVLLKDSEVTTDTINEKTGAAGVTIDGVVLKDSGIVATADPSVGDGVGNRDYNDARYQAAGASATVEYSIVSSPQTMNSTTPTSTTLTASLTNGWWSIEASLAAYSISATPDMILEWTYSGTVVESYHGYVGANALGVVTGDSNNDAVGGPFLVDLAAGSGVKVHIHGYVQVTNSGTLTLNYYQNVSDAALIQIGTGSWIRLTKII